MKHSIAPLMFMLALAPLAHAQSPEFLNALPSDRPVPVTARFDLRDINAIDDEAESVSFTGVLTLSWSDPRQAFDPAAEGIAEKIYQGDYQFNELFTGWAPQVILANEAGTYEKHGVVLRVLPEGDATLIETVNATAKCRLDLRRYPFDSQRVELAFALPGFSADEVLLRVDPAFEGVAIGGAWPQSRMPQWHMTTGTLSSELRDGDSTLLVSLDLRRQPLFLLRLVVLPTAIMVMLSWTVFWMDRSSLGDRMNVSFVGILTAVAYLVVLSEIQPKISYMTLMNSFLNVSFFLMCATVPVNLRVSILDRTGRGPAGDRFDRRCRWLFPAIYVALLLASVALTFWLLPPP